MYNDPTWMFVSVFGTEYVYKNISASLEDFMNGHKPIFKYARTDKYHLLMNGGVYESRFIEVKEITNFNAYKIFGIRGMEEASEKTISQLPINIKKERNNKLDRLKN